MDVLKFGCYSIFSAFNLKLPSLGIRALLDEGVKPLFAIPLLLRENQRRKEWGFWHFLDFCKRDIRGCRRMYRESSANPQTLENQCIQKRIYEPRKSDCFVWLWLFHSFFKILFLQIFGGRLVIDYIRAFPTCNSVCLVIVSKFH